MPFVYINLHGRTTIIDEMKNHSDFGYKNITKAAEHITARQILDQRLEFHPNDLT